MLQLPNFGYITVILQACFHVNRLCPVSLYHERYVKFPITNRTDKLNVQIKEPFCENVAAINILKNTLILKDAVVMKSDIF